MLNVSYGHGRDPICTITDSDAMSIPVMQAVPIDPENAPFCRDWQTALLPGIRSIAKASFAKASGAEGWRTAPARAGFGVLPKPGDADDTGVFAMRTTLTAVEALEALLLFGANAPFKIWLNGKKLLTDSKATLPVNANQYKVALRLKQGSNDLLVAFAPPSADANLGICARVATPQMRRDPRIAG